VDDFLGVGGGHLDDLLVLDWRLDEELASWLLDAAEEHSWRQDRVERAVMALEALAMHADDEGRLRTSLRSVAEVMEMPAQRVRRGVTDLIALGAVESDRVLETVPGTWRGGRYVGSIEWADRPTLTLHPGCRATRLPDRQLAAVQGPPPMLDQLSGLLCFWSEWRASGPSGYSPRDLAILTEIVDGAPLSEAAEGSYRNPETARRRTPCMSWAVAMQHIVEEVTTFELAAAGCSVHEIVEGTGLSETKVRTTLRRGKLSERWLHQVKNADLRHEAEKTVAALVEAARKSDQLSP